MEQSSSPNTPLVIPETNGWFAQRCQDLVFKILNKIDNACLEVEDCGEVHYLGNVKSTLRGKFVVHDRSLYIDFIKGGSIAAAEAFIQNKWSSPDLTALIQVFARAQRALDEVEKQNSFLSKIKNKLFHSRNANTRSGSKKNILAHYDLGNDLYTRFLDSTMMYSSAIYSSQGESLHEAQKNKLKTICDKLQLCENDHVIEIGTGWGGLAIYAAENYGCKVTTTTISDAQFELAKQRVEEANLSDKITLLKQDYRLLQGQYDKLVSIEMIEAVGHDFMAEFFAKCNSLLKDSGKMLIQAITISDGRYDHYRNNVDFIQRYIFPGGCLPSISVMANHVAQQTNMVIDNIEDIGLHYARTLADWRKKFEDNWHEIKEVGYDESFKRLWLYYLSYCEGGFKERVISTHHLVMRKPGHIGRDDEQVLAY